MVHNKYANVASYNTRCAKYFQVLNWKSRGVTSVKVRINKRIFTGKLHDLVKSKSKVCNEKFGIQNRRTKREDSLVG